MIKFLFRVILVINIANCVVKFTMKCLSDLSVGIIVAPMRTHEEKEHARGEFSRGGISEKCRIQFKHVLFIM